MLPTHSVTHRININISRERKCSILMKYWTKAKLKPSRANSKPCSSMSSVKGLLWLFPSSFADCETLLSSSGSTSVGAVPGSYPMALAPPTSWDLQYSSLSQLHAVATLGLSARTSQAHTWPLQLSLTTEDPTPFTLISFMTLKARITWLMLPSSSAYLG